MALAPAREAFMPPPTPGLGRAVLMALVAHAALVLALSFAVQWRQSAPEPVAFVAELWAAVPTEAAPPAPEPLPVESVIEPPPAPTPAPEPKPVPKPVPPPVAAPPEPPKPADIALEKKKALQEAKKKQELAQAKAQAALQLEKDKAEKQKKRKAEAEKLQADKEKTAKLKEDKLKAEKRLKEEKAAEAARKKEAQQAAEEAAQSEQRRKEAKDRALRLAASAVGNGDADAKGSAAQSAGPSASYGAKVAAAIRTNINQVKEITGNPSVEYDVTTDPGGNVLSAKLRKKSGDPYWDETALNAILKTGKLPRDENGRVPSPMTIALEPKPR
jgi:colicin import membrane protein